MIIVSSMRVDGDSAKGFALYWDMDKLFLSWSNVLGSTGNDIMEMGITLAHEIGHASGLNHPKGQTNDYRIMGTAKPAVGRNLLSSAEAITYADPDVINGPNNGVEE